jgi:hypothetical protein
VLARGTMAAVSSGLAFYLVLPTLWGRPPASGRSYVWQFAAWAIAWAPGILAIGSDAPARRCPTMRATPAGVTRQSRGSCRRCRR